MVLAVGFVQVAILFVALVLAWYYFKSKRDSRYPPGPTPLPFIGNLLQFGSKPQLKLIEWAEEYGPVYSIKMGSNDTIIISDYKILKDVFSDNRAIGRTPNPIFVAFGGGNYGVVMSEGVHWESQRRFALRKLRDLGFAKSSTDGVIMDEANSMLAWLEKRVDQPISGNRLFNGAIVNALWGIVSGESTKWDAPDPPMILKNAEGITSSINRMNATGLVFAPFLRFIAPEYFGWNKWIHNISAFGEITAKSVQKHLQELDWNNPRDLIDHYLIEKQTTTDPSSSFYKEEGDKNLKALIPDLFLAGSETTSHTLSYALLFLSHNESVQRKMQAEIDTVVGHNRQPSINDRPNMPYTESVITETLRMTTILNNGVPHRMTQDAVIQGYFFPENATIIANLYSINNDPKTWGDPENFRPERHLSSDGKKCVRSEAFMPFSTGKRDCLGTGLALQSLFLFVSAIFQKFGVKPDPNDSGEAIRNTKPSDKMLNEPDMFKVIVSLRN